MLKIKIKSEKNKYLLSICNTLKDLLLFFLRKSYLDLSDN